MIHHLGDVKYTQHYYFLYRHTCVNATKETENHTLCLNGLPYKRDGKEYTMDINNIESLK